MRLFGAALVVGGLLTLLYLGILHGWRARERRHGALAALPAPPAPPHDLDTSEVIEGVYVATTTAYDWSERIEVHGLGVRSRAAVAIDVDGLGVLRSAAPSFFIPAEELLAVRTARGGEATGLVVFTWQHDGHRLDTGFRPRLPTDVQRLVDLGADLVMDAPNNADEPVKPEATQPLPQIEYDPDDLDLDLEPDLDPRIVPELGSELGSERRRHYANGDTR